MEGDVVPQYSSAFVADFMKQLSKQTGKGWKVEGWEKWQLWQQFRDFTGVETSAKGLRVCLVFDVLGQFE